MRTRRMTQIEIARYYQRQENEIGLEKKRRKRIGLRNPGIDLGAGGLPKPVAQQAKKYFSKVCP